MQTIENNLWRLSIIFAMDPVCSSPVTLYSSSDKYIQLFYQLHFCTLQVLLFLMLNPVKVMTEMIFKPTCSSFV